jgi:hypothetical protein
MKIGLDQYLIAKKFFWTKNYETNGQDKAEKIKKMFPEMKGKRFGRQRPISDDTERESENKSKNRRRESKDEQI